MVLLFILPDHVTRVRIKTYHAHNFNYRLLPVLRRLFTPDSFLEERYPHILYFPLSKNRIDRVRIYIKDRDFQNVLDFKQPLYCTLHLRKR